MTLNSKLILPVVSGYIIIALIVHFIWVPKLLNDEHQQFNTHQQKLIKTIEPEVTRSILSNDFATLFDFLDTQVTLNKDDWNKIEVRLTDGQLIYPFDEIILNANNDSTKIKTILKSFDQEIGHILLVADWSNQTKVIQHNLNLLEIYLLIVFGAIISIGIVWQNHQIKRPILKLTRAAAEFSAGNFNVTFQKTGDDEIGQLAESFINMQSIRRTYEKDLIESKDRAEDATRAKGEFLASMSHEIRTPMNGVLGMLSLLLNSKLDSEQLNRVNIAQSSAKSLLNVIDDILDFSKIDAGKMDLEYLDFNLRTMLDELIETMAYMAQEKNIELIVDASGVNETMVKGDPGRLRQILTNLISNSIKFTSHGEIIIQVNLQPIEAQHWQFNCSITDTGIGIPAEKTPSLFDSFSQVDNSTTRKYGGTGLGLAIAKKICKLMNGDIKVRSEVDKGSCFEFHLTLEKSTKSMQVLPKVNMQSLSLLVVDDNATNREALSAQLKHWGATVVEADSAKQAIAICEDTIKQKNDAFFNIAFLDMQMPDMDGADLGKRLKKDKRFSSMKLIMMTSMGYQGDAKFFSELGFSAYFPKPTTTKDLFNVLSVVAEGGETLKNAEPLVTKHYLNDLLPNEEESKNTKNIRNLTDAVRILLVEDNHVNQLVATGILNQIGLHSDIAANGLEAIARLKQAPENKPYSIIIMDCQMPEMDGYEATRQIRKGCAGDFNKTIPIIAMTANAMKGDKEKCLDSGMDDYIAKPVEPDELIRKINQWLPTHIANKDRQ